MVKEFLRYFIFYIFNNKTRQRLLLLAVIGLFISAFALIVLQSTMGGLQSKVVFRSKRVQGSAILYFKENNLNVVKNVLKDLQKKGVKAYMEYEIELLLRHDNYITPVVAHGIDPAGELPYFLEKEKLTGLVVPDLISFNMRINHGSRLQLISPSHVNAFFEDIPRYVSEATQSIVSTEVPEVDSFHIWARLPLIQNLIEKQDANRIRIFGEYDFKVLNANLKKFYGDSYRMVLWEQENHTLVWALNLETTVMVFLFASMTLLV